MNEIMPVWDSTNSIPLYVQLYEYLEKTRDMQLKIQAITGLEML